MIVSLSWLKKYVDIPTDTRTLASDLTMLGLNVEHITSSGIDEPLVVVGHVLERKPHPDADRLSVCTVDAGGPDGPIEIVCGAPNVAGGQRVPVALVGATLPGDFKIRKSRIRGVVSSGMICSARELGLGTDADGIMVLDTTAAPGTPFSTVLGDIDTIFEIEVTPNRPDQLSHIGVAREIAAMYSVPLRIPAAEVSGKASTRPGFTVAIADPADCYRFTGRVVRGVRVGPSPAWLRQAVESIGHSSINNVVDITNYVMMETGQPLHAYDLAKLDGKIGVRRAREGESIVALDGDTYKLVADHLLITDGDTPVGIAGVIGGMDTRVTEETVDLLIEGAAFDPRVVRRSRRATGISTDASYRFERGSDPDACMTASNRATTLIIESAGGKAGECIDEWPTGLPRNEIRIRVPQTRRLLGLSLSLPEIENLLGRLGFEATTSDAESITVRVPSWRRDIVEEVDLIEEVARLHGYDRIGRGWSFRTTCAGQMDPLDRFLDGAAEHLCARGFNEILSSSFLDAPRLGALGLPPGDRRLRPLEVRNPLSTQHRFLRTTLLPGVLDAIRHNMDHGLREVRVFEPGAIFLPRDGGQGLPEEPFHILVAVTRPDTPDFWLSSSGTADLIDIKRELEIFALRQRIPLARLQYGFDATSGSFTYRDRDSVVIEGGPINPPMAAHWGFDQPVWWAEANMSALSEIRDRRRTFREISGYPPSRRDLSLVAPPGVVWTDLQKALERYGGRLLESAQVFDVYRGDRIDREHTAYGVRLTFRSNETTLTDADVDAIIDKVIRKLQSEHAVHLRS